MHSKFERGDSIWWHQRGTKKFAAVVVRIPEDNDQRSTVIIRKENELKQYEVSEFWLEKREDND